jgi:hypothetical protein
VANEYTDDLITDNSEDAQRLRQAEFRAKKKRIAKEQNQNGANLFFRGYGFPSQQNTRPQFSGPNTILE